MSCTLGWSPRVLLALTIPNGGEGGGGVWTMSSLCLVLICLQCLCKHATFHQEMGPLKGTKYCFSADRICSRVMWQGGRGKRGVWNGGQCSTFWMDSSLIWQEPGCLTRNSLTRLRISPALKPSELSPCRSLSDTRRKLKGHGPSTWNPPPNGCPNP